MSDMAGIIDSQSLVGRVATALRYAVTGAAPTDWFGPGVPLAPQAPEEVRGRRFDYAFFANINYKPRGAEPLSFERLKTLARHPIVAMIIQRQKDRIASIDWQIKPRKNSAAAQSDVDDPQIASLTEFFMYPDKEHDWCQWISAVLDQLMVLDAVSIYGAPTRMGDLHALQVLDGAMIKPVLDLGGRRPSSPMPAYQQVLKGLPAIDYTADELIYFPQVYRADKTYGYSRVEQAADLIETAISRLRSQKGYFDYGNIGDGYFTAPDNWTPEQVLGLQNQWNAMMQNVDPAIRRSAPFLPQGTEWHETKKDILADHFDEFIIRLLCFPFGVSPNPFIKQVGLGQNSASSDREAAEEGGVAPLMQYTERLMSMALAKWFGRPDLEFAFIEDREFDPKTKAEIEDIRLRNGTLSINDVKDRNGEKPFPDGDKPMIYLGSGPILLENAINPQPDPAPKVPATGFAQPSGAEGTAPEGQAAPVEQGLTKAADIGATAQLEDIVASYLSQKAQSIAAAISDKLIKVDPADGYSSRIDDAFDEIDFTWSDFPEIVQPVIAGVAVAAGSNAISQLGLFSAETLARVSARSVEYAAARGAELVGMKYVAGELVTNSNAAWSITTTTREALRKAIVNSLTEGTSNDDLRKTIIENAAFSRKRADMIARSETAIADVRGAAIGWIESGVVTSARFDASPECCDICQIDDGKIVPLTDPSDLDLPHPACRCTWLAVLDDETTAKPLSPAHHPQN